MCLSCGLESVLGDLFLLTSGGIAIGSNTNLSLQSSPSDGIDGMDAIRIPNQFIKSRNDWTCVY